MAAATAPFRQQVIQTYIRLLHVQKNTFGADLKNLIVARKYTRAEFDKNKLESDPTKIQEMIGNAQAAAEYVEKCVVQTVRQGSGPTKVSLKSTHNFHSEFNMEPTFFDLGGKSKGGSGSGCGCK